MRPLSVSPVTPDTRGRGYRPSPCFTPGWSTRRENGRMSGVLGGSDPTPARSRFAPVVHDRADALPRRTRVVTQTHLLPGVAGCRSPGTDPWGHVRFRYRLHYGPPSNKRSARVREGTPDRRSPSVSYDAPSPPSGTLSGGRSGVWGPRERQDVSTCDAWERGRPKTSSSLERPGGPTPDRVDEGPRPFRPEQTVLEPSHVVLEHRT